MQKYALIAVGGALGALARYGMGSAIGQRLGTRFPFGTLFINITACFAIGFFLVLPGRRLDDSPALRFLIPIGFIGAYSTFSTFEWETFASMEAGAFLMAAVYVALSLLLGLVAVWLGVSLAKWIS